MDLIVYVCKLVECTSMYSIAYCVVVYECVHSFGFWIYMSVEFLFRLAVLFLPEVSVRGGPNSGVPGSLGINIRDFGWMPGSLAYLDMELISEILD